MRAGLESNKTFHLQMISGGGQGDGQVKCLFCITEAKAVKEEDARTRVLRSRQVMGPMLCVFLFTTEYVQWCR